MSSSVVILFIFFEAGSLTEPRVPHFARVVCKPGQVGAGETNTGLHAGTARRFPTELSS